MRPLLPTTLLAVLCTVPGVAWADSAAPNCRQLLWGSSGPEYRAAKVVGAPRTYFRTDEPPCPAETAACRKRAYVLPGDMVLVAGTTGPYVCALFPGKHDDVTGYVLQTELAVQSPPTATPLSAWTGKWADGDNTIMLRPRGKDITVAGHAYWPSANPPLSVAPGGPNLGEVSGAAIPTGNKVAFVDKDNDDCRLSLTLLPPFLVASDNGNCGGANVTFDGVFRRP